MARMRLDSLVWDPSFHANFWSPARYSMDGLESDDEAEKYGCYPFVLLILNQPLGDIDYYDNLRQAGTSPVAERP